MTILSRTRSRAGVHLRSGFTIIEVLLAVGLTTLLMAAMYSAMNIYWTTAADSYDEIERVQVSRSLLRFIARDIKSVTFVEQDTMESDEEESEDSTTEDTAMSSYDNGLFGTDKDLVLFVSRPTRDAAYVDRQALVDPSDRSSDAMIIRYFLADSGGGGLGAAVANTFADPDFPEGIVGLARMKGDLAGLSLAINSSDLSQQEAASELVAREVADLQFQYWDGLEYQPEWDSTEANAMPQAIEVIIRLRTLIDPEDPREPEDIPGWIPETEHKIVVPIPVARPYVGEDL